VDGGQPITSESGHLGRCSLVLSRPNQVYGAMRECSGLMSWKWKVTVGGRESRRLCLLGKNGGRTRSKEGKGAL
jgi:hypothetical protein